MGTKSQTLAEFHFDKERSGEILRRWADDSGLTRQELADRVGMSVHTLNNSLYGKVQDLSVDRTFKIAVATGHSVCEYIRLMLEGESIDFADQIHVLRDADMTLVKYTEDIPAAVKPSEPPADALLDRFRRVYDTMLSQLRDQVQQLKDSREIMHQQYQQQLETMERQHVIHNTAMETHHAEAMQRADKEIDRLQLQNTRLRTALIIETSAIGILFFADALIGDRGWILRSLLDLGGKTGYITKG